MGTIAQKLEYLNDTRLLLKDNINKINNVLDDNSTFRSYPQELFNGYLDILNNGTDTLWNNLEKVSQTGTEAVLENVETAPMKVELQGNTSQDTTTGKNLFDKSLFQNFTDAIKFISLNLKPNTQYTVSSDIPSSYNSANLFALNSTGNPSTTTNGVTPSVPRTVTTLDDGILRIGYRDNGNVLEDEKNNYWYQVEEGSTATSYEPYTGGQPSPSPDYPQEVKVVKGENVVSVQSKNMANFSILGKVPSVSNGELVNYFDDAGCTELIEIDNTKEYVFSFEMITAYDKYVFFYDENKNYITNKGNPESGYKLNDEQVFPRTKYVRIRIDKMPNFKNIQLEQNSQATPYVPYSKTDYPINLAPNMLPLNVEDWEQGGIGSSTGTETVNATRLRTKDFIPIEYAQPIILTANIANTNYSFVNIIWYDQNKNFLLPQSQDTQIVDSKKVSFIINTNNAKYFRVVLKNADNVSTITPEEITIIQPSLQKDYQYTEPIELCKINTYKDYFHKDSGKWYVHKEIGKVVLNGSENWSVESSTDDTNTFKTYLSSRIKVSNLALCNILTRATGVTETFAWLAGGGATFIKIYKTRASDVSSFKNWLSTNNAIIYYVLATPTEEEITDTTLIEQLEAINNAKSVKDKTYVTQTNDDLPFILDVEAIKEYEVN